MKKSVAFAVVLVVVLCVAVVVVKRLREGSVRTPTPQTPALANSGATNVVQSAPKATPPTTIRETNDSSGRVGSQHIPSRAERLKMPRQERLQLLEKLGCVPPDPDWSDYALAEKTSWWGKKVDPKTFWSNRVIWLDGTTVGGAWRHGRSYPPIPYDDPSVADRSDKDNKGDGFDIQGGPSFSTVSSQREVAFWDKFVKTHPHPPDDIIRWQRDQAESWIRDKNILEYDPTYAARLGMKPERLDRMLETNRREGDVFGYPPECLTPDAYRWSHIMQKRQEYEVIRASGQDTDNVTLSNFFRRVYVDRKYITEPLSAEDIQVANAWKIAYLRRLRQEKTDESYINAYMQAWKLSSNDVFGMTP